LTITIPLIPHPENYSNKHNLDLVFKINLLNKKMKSFFTFTLQIKATIDSIVKSSNQNTDETVLTESVQQFYSPKPLLTSASLDSFF